MISNLLQKCNLKTLEHFVGSFLKANVLHNQKSVCQEGLLNIKGNPKLL